MSNETILVAAPRKLPWNEADPSSLIVLTDVGRLHPANPAYKMPIYEICICEGQGIKGDPGKQEEPWEVFPYPKIVAKIREGRLVEVQAGEDTSPLAMSDNSLRSLDISDRTFKGLEQRLVTSVPDLAEKLDRADDPVGWLSSIKGIGEPTAEDILEQLRARDLLGA